MKFKPTLIIFLIFFLVVMTVYILSPSITALSVQELYLVAPVGAALIGLYTSRIYGFKSANGRALLLITIGLVCWAIAEIIGLILDYFLAVDNLIPRFDSLFFLIAYPIFGAGIYQSFITANINLKLVKKSLLAAVLSASVILIGLVAYFGVYQAYDPSADLLTNAVNLGYGVGDLILVIFSLLAILIVSEYKGGKLASFWGTIVAGFLLFLIADTLFFTMYGDLVMADIKPYTYIDLIWVGGYMLLAYAMLENYIHVTEVQKNIKLMIQQRNNTKGV